MSLQFHSKMENTEEYCLTSKNQLPIIASKIFTHKEFLQNQWIKPPSEQTDFCWKILRKPFVDTELIYPGHSHDNCSIASTFPSFPRKWESPQYNQIFTKNPEIPAFARMTTGGTLSCDCPDIVASGKMTIIRVS